MRIVQLIGTLDPAYGGPVTIACAWHRALRAAGVDARLVSLDAAPSRAPEHDDTFGLGPARGTYRFVRHGLPPLMTLCEDADALMVHGIWQYQTRLARRVHEATGVPYWVMAHGALSPWFRRAYPWKEPKKWLYWWLTEAQALRRAQAVVFSTDQERQTARGQFRPYRIREAVLPYGIEAPRVDLSRARSAFLKDHPRFADRRIVLFLGRLHAVKGLDLLVDAWIPIARRDRDLHLVVAGPDRDGVWPSLLTRLTSVGLADRATAIGTVAAEAKWGAFAAADLLCLPSHSENFGAVVAEALACALPVLITDKVGVQREVREAGAGIVVSDTADGVRAGLERWLRTAAEDRTRMRAAARACFDDQFSMNRTVASIRTLVETARESNHSWKTGR